MLCTRGRGERGGSLASEQPSNTPQGAPVHIFFVSIFGSRTKHRKFVTKIEPHGSVLYTRGRGELGSRSVRGIRANSALLSRYELTTLFLFADFEPH